MATYCTSAHMINRFGQNELIQLTDRVNGVAIDTTVLSAAIADASSEIDSYIGGLIEPGDPPAHLVRIACDLARYHLYDDLSNEEVRIRHENALRWLQDAAAGKIAPPPHPAIPPRG